MTRRPPGMWVVTALLLAGTGLLVARGADQPRFLADDPLSQEPETQDASAAKYVDIELAPDLLLNLFTKPGDPTPNVPAGNVNTIDEVPDSGWFTNRIYARPVSADEIARGPNQSAAPAPGKWTIVSAKTEGVSPGFTARDSRGVRWFVQFDTAGHPRAATSAVPVAMRCSGPWATTRLRPTSSPAARRPADRRQDDHRDPREPSPPHAARRCRRRAGTSCARCRRHLSRERGLAVPGRVIGPFKYYGTRADDPNDVVLHEHRRELRALKVFGAWANLVDMKAGNTLDTVVDERGRGVVRHYLQDVGSTFGAGALGPREWDEGYEYLYEGTALWKRLVSMGFFMRPWQTIPYRELPEVGRFEGDRFDPETWRPRVPTAAMSRADDRDTFWAALRVAAFSDDLIRAAVATGEYTDPDAARLLGDVLIKRRDAIARTYLPKLNSLTRFALDGRGRLTFVDAAVVSGVAPAASRFDGQWFRYENATDTSHPLGASQGTSGLEAPSTLPSTEGAIVKIVVTPTVESQAHRRVEVYFRRHAEAWRLVGVERIGGS